MATGSRIVFTRFPSEKSARFVSWQEFSTRATGRSVGPAGRRPAASGTVVVWSLVSGNNRELARSSTAFFRFDAAMNDASDVLAAHAVYAVRYVNDSRRGSYGWVLEDDGRVRVTCARWYESERDRRDAVRASLAAFAFALVEEGARAAAPDADRVTT